MILENTPGNARFSVIVHAGSPVSTIYASMLRLYMLMKTYPVIPSRPPEPASSARYGPIGYVLPVEPAREQEEAIHTATAAIYQPPASHRTCLAFLLHIKSYGADRHR